jgi:mono/diheme cytochrome c family protein
MSRTTSTSRRRWLHPSPAPGGPSAHHRDDGRWVRWLPLLSVALAAAVLPLVLGQTPAEAGPSDETLIEGAEVYTAVCASCHQAGGIGVAGQYPPLRDNPNVADAAYVEDVIRNGRDGLITVNGETYDAVMPAQPSLSDDDIVNVIAYIQSGFAAPAGPAPEVSTGPVAGTELPLLSNYTIIFAFAIAAGAVGLVLGPRVIAANDRTQVTWLDAWLKSAVIVVAMILGTTIVPSRVLEIETVQKLPRAAQDLIAVGLWGGALLAGLWALWYAHRERRI